MAAKRNAANQFKIASAQEAVVTVLKITSGIYFSNKKWDKIRNNLIIKFKMG